jgi:hypothetical protein
VPSVGQPSSAQQPSSLQLYSRACTINIGGIQIANNSIGLQTGLDVWFQVRTSLKPKKPNTCDLRVTNLTAATRQAIAQATNGAVGAAGGKVTSSSATSVVGVSIQAGYVGGVSTIFLGEMRSATTTLDSNGTDFILEMTTGGNDQAQILARSTASFGKGCNAYVVAQQLIADMGLSGGGNIATVQPILLAQKCYSGGIVLKGNSWEHLVDLAHSCGLEVSMQNGTIQWLSIGQPLAGQAYSLTSSTGLIGSPSVDNTGLLKCQTMLLPGLAPGQPVQISSKFVQTGLYRIISIETTGTTSGPEWGHQLELKSYGPTTGQAA